MRQLMVAMVASALSLGLSTAEAPTPNTHDSSTLPDWRSRVNSRDTLSFRFAKGTDRELATAELIRTAYSQYDFRDWLVTDQILIDAESIPHSHPVLTLHTRHLEDPDALLATFVHEQFHWWVMDRPGALSSAREAFQAIWPTVPSREDGGARDDSSTYLHLVVCDLEYQATALLLGEEVARSVLAGTTHYEWIYEQVLGDPRVRQVMETNGMVLK